MGNCVGGKQQDVQRDRKRIERKAQQESTPSKPTAAPSGDVRTAAKGIAIAKSVDDKGGEKDVYGTSYTNRKTKEVEWMHNIVKQTKDNFIDVAHKPAALDEQDASKREQTYGRKLNEAAISRSVTSIYSLPTAVTLDAAALAALLGAPVPQADIDFSTSEAAKAGLAVEAMTIQSVGPFVLTFEELT